MYSAYKLNKQGDNIQPWCTPFPIWNQSVVPCPVLTVASWPAYSFLKRQVSQFSLAAQSCPTLQPHILQHTRLAIHHQCPEPTQTTCPLYRWCHPIISSCVVPFFSCNQSFPASGSFSVSQFFPSGGQSIGGSASAVSPSNDYSGLISFRIDWFDLLAVQGTLKSLLQHHSSKQQFFDARPSLWSNSHIQYMTTGKTIALTIWIFVGKVMSLLFNMLSRFVIAFLPRRKHLTIDI